MLTAEEKKHIKDVLGDGLNINRNINFPYFLNAIDETNNNVKALESTLNTILYNQKVLDQKLNNVIDLCRKLLNK